MRPNGLDLASHERIGEHMEETCSLITRWPSAKVAPTKDSPLIALGAEAAVKLSNPEQILRFQKWLES